MPDLLADRLVDFALSTTYESLPEGVVYEARRRLLDAFACATGALHEPSSSIARKVAKKFSGETTSTLFGGGRSTPDWAAFANGVHIRYLDCNDTYLSLEPAHPSDNWAAVMAIGEVANSTGKDWIVAGSIAYEIQCRLCDAASIRARGWDHPTYGHLSACLAACKLLGLSHEQSVHALGIAGTTGTQLRLTRAGELSMWKGCAFAHASRNAVFAAMVAADGLTGPAPLFEGDMGFWQQVSGKFDLPKLGGPTTDDWMLPKTSIKYWPAEYHSQSAIAAALELRSQIGEIGKVRSIEIATFKTAVEIIGKDPEKWRPKTRETADHSLPYCTAVALIDGDVAAAQFSHERLNDASLLDLVARTTVIEDPALTAGYPHGIPNRIKVTLDDGKVFESEIAFPPGHDKNPLTDALLETKFRSLIEPEFGAERATAIWARLSNLESDTAPHEALHLLDFA